MAGPKKINKDLHFFAYYYFGIHKDPTTLKGHFLPGQSAPVVELHPINQEVKVGFWVRHIPQLGGGGGSGGQSMQEAANQ